MAQPNQFGNSDFQKLTYSMDPRNPDALAASKSIEAMVKNTIAQLQREGSPVMHGQRRYDANGTRNTDYYVPGQHAAVVQNAVMAAIERYEAQIQRSTGISLSSASPATFRTQTANIMSPQTRAEVERLVKAHGGFFNKTPDGMVNWGLDKGIRVTGSGGREFNLATSLIARIGASNAQHRSGFENLLNQATGKSYSYSDYNDIERQAMSQAARSAIARRARRGVSAETEREEVYERLAKRSRAYAHAQQYALDNPNDPLVARRNAVLKKMRRKARNKKIKGAGRFAMGTIGTAIATVLAVLGLGVATLVKIKDAVLSIGSDIKRQNKADQTYNFAEGTMRTWERFAGQRGIKKELLGQAAGGLVSAWSSPLAYAESNFDKLAPYLKSGTVNLVRMAGNGGDENILGILDSVIDDLAQKSQAGASGTRTGMTTVRAFSENLRPLAEHNAAWGELMSNYWYDAQRNGGVGNWYVNGRKMDFEAYRTQAEWNPKYATVGANGISNGAIRDAAEGTYNSANSLLVTIDGLKTDVFERIFSNTQQLVENMRSLLTQWIGKYFPAFAMKEQQRTMYMNGESEKLASANLPIAEAAAKSSMDRFGLGGLKNARGVYDAVKSGNYKKLFPGMDTNAAAQRLAAMKSDPNLIPDIKTYLDTIDALDAIEESRQNDYNRTIIYSPESLAASVSTGALLADLGYEKMGKKLGVNLVGGEGYVDLKKFLGGKMNQKTLNDFIARQDALYASGQRDIAISGAVGGYDAAETALVQKLYAYEFMGKGKEAAAARAALKGYYGTHGKYGSKMSEGEIATAMQELDDIFGSMGELGRVAAPGLAARAATQVLHGDALAFAVQNMAQVNAGLSKLGFSDMSDLVGKQLQFTPTGGEGAGGVTVVNLVQYLDGKQVLNKRVATIRNSGLEKPVTIPIANVNDVPVRGLTEALNAQMRDN